MLSIRVKLHYCSSSNAQTLIQRLKEFTTTFKWIVALFTSNTKPLYRRYTNCPIKYSRPKFPALPNIYLPQPTIWLSLFRCNVQHVATDINTFPKKSILLKGLPWQSWPTSNIKDQRIRFSIEELNGSLGKLSLDVLYTSVRLIFGGLGYVIVEVWWKLILWSHIIIAKWSYSSPSNRFNWYRPLWIRPRKK